MRRKYNEEEALQRGRKAFERGARMLLAEMEEVDVSVIDKRIEENNAKMRAEQEAAEKAARKKSRRILPRLFGQEDADNDRGLGE